MRLLTVALLASSSLLAVSTTAVSKVGIPETGIFTRSLILDHRDVLTKRLLRSHKTSTDANDEERGVSTAGVESLSNPLKSTTSSQQLKDWLTKGETTDDVFKLLTLDKATDDLLARPQLQAWINYMKLFNKENPKQQTTLIKTLTNHYGDEALIKIIETAKQNPATATIAKRLQTEQIHHWIVQEKTPDDIFKLMKLNTAKDQLFKNPLVVTWAKYVDVFNKANPSKKTTLYAAVEKYDDEILVNMVIAAKGVPSTEKIAVRVQADLTSAWLESKKTPNTVFKLLKLNQDGDSLLLENPIFIAWIKYTDDFNLMHPKKAESVISTLARHYSSAKLEKMLIEAHKTPSTAKLANELHLDLLENWFRNGNTPSHVFNLLQLDNTGDKLFDSPLLTTWLQYIVYFRQEKPERKVSVVSILKNHYKDDVLAKMLVEARRVPSTKKTAADLLDALTIRWMYNKKPPARVYKWLLVEGTAADDAARKLYNNYDRLFKMKYPYY